MENNSVTQSASMGFLLLEEVQFFQVKDDVLSQWEFVNVLETEEGGENGDDWDCAEHGFRSWDSSNSLPISPNVDPISETPVRVLYPDADLKVHRECDVDDDNVERHSPDLGGENGRGFQFSCEDSDGHGEEKADDDDNEEEEDEDDNGCDLDDELVPWSVSCKFGRQRMRKLGKRACSKMKNSKRNPYLFVRPGCVRGKHGLGLKHNL